MKILAPHANVAIPPICRALCVYQSLSVRWLGGRRITVRETDESDWNILPRWRRLLLWRARARYLRANPRDLAYMLAVAREFLNQKAPGAEVDLLLEVAASPVPAGFDVWPRHIWRMPNTDSRTWPTQLLQQLQRRMYDTVLFLYPDPIGTGWPRAERRLAGLNAEQYLIINGRQRVFFWDGESRRALAWRRFLERSWLVEFLLIPAVVCMTAGLALLDALRKRLKSSKKMDQ